MRTTLGRVGERPSPDSYRKLLSDSVSTASSLVILLANLPGRFREYEVRFFNMEKPSGVDYKPTFYVSTNGATVESGNSYEYSIQYYSATSALTASGGSAISGWNLGSGSAFALATATGRHGSWGSARFYGSANANVDCQLQAEWHYLNSASTPSVVRLSGYFASGPLAALVFDSQAGRTISFDYDVYGIGLPT